MANPKIEMLVDSFTAPTINTALWNVITAGTASLDTVNDQIALQVPTTASTNTFGTSNLFDATGSRLYAQIGIAANGNGNTRTILRVQLNTNNSMSIRVESGVFKQVNTTGGTSTTVTLPTYDSHAHRWWRLREAGGVFYADASADGLNWTNFSSMAYTWDATQVSVRFESVAGATEVAGNVSLISNINTRQGGHDNLNWPRIEDAWGPFWSVNAGTMPLDRMVDISDRTRGTASITRGRQYELDQVRAGEATLRLANDDAALDPVNAAGPWYGHIAPYQPIRRRAQWPPSRNLLDQVAATAGNVGGYSLGTIPGGSSGVDIFSDTEPAGGQFVSSATAWQGSTCMQFAVQSGATTNLRPCHTLRWSVAPGQTYTVTLRVRNITPSTSLSVKALIGWYAVGGGLNPTTNVYGSTATLTGSAAAAWTTITVTATATANAAGIDVGVALAANAASTCAVQVGGWQLEKGAVSTPWTCPGVWYPMYSGFVERWPSSWDGDGTYGLVEPTAVDAFSLLSQKKLDDPLTQEIHDHSPRFVYKLDDPAGSTSVADWTGQNPAAQLAISKYGAGSITFGSAVTSTDPAGTYTGSTGTVATISNSNPGTNLITGGASFISLGSAGIFGPTNPALWTRGIAFRYTGPTPTTAACMWSSMDAQRSAAGPSGSHIYVYIDNTGKPVLALMGPTGAGAPFYAGGATNCVHGNWHFLLFGFNAAGGQVMFSLDGATAAFYGSQPASYTPSGLASDNVGGFVDSTVGNGTVWNFKGDIAMAFEFPVMVNSTQISDLYGAWKAACAGESSDARYKRILRYGGYKGPSTVQTGLTTNMGLANLDGQDVMSALQGVVDTEGGEHYIDRSGFVQFKARSARYNATAPVYVFGEREDLGEWPYEECQLDFDSTHLSNEVTVTQDGSGQNFYAQDDASITAYFPRTLSRTINAANPAECQDAANYLLSRYKQPATRVSSVKLHPSGNPALWPVCLSLELGTRARVMRRPPGVPAIQVECFVENLQWDTGDDGEAWLTIQCSPADTTPYGLFAAFHTTLASSSASGVSTITLNAGSDNTNLAAAQIGQGQQLVLGLGTANEETVTVLSVASTSPGWTTVVVTLQAATTKAHTAGDVVCEPLPAGVTDPTTYDASSQFDVANFAY
ncbi:hypothetical protein ACIRH0_04190 [Streptomyces sp. NPDC093675]|uniref:hypothetical protein n=1 Tax=Streptomyces sp. NPDC093675 TaxID=3366049 RepID=UPI003811ACC6